MKRKQLCGLIASLLLSTMVIDISAAMPQKTAFSYQGQLNAGGTFPTGEYQFTFTLFDSESDGSIVSGTMPIKQSIQVIDGNAKMTAAAGKYLGLDRYDARKQIVADLEALGLMEKIEPYKLSVGKCQRCRTIVEPLVSKQWWILSRFIYLY